MKTIKSLFSTKKEIKSLNLFSQLDFTSMSKIKGGDDEDAWPEKGSGSSSGSSGS